MADRETSGLPDGATPGRNGCQLSGTSVKARAEQIAALAGKRPRSGRGIVVAAGGARIFVNAYVLVAVLRRTLSCALPIEIWHFGAREISPSMAAALDGLGVTLVDADALVERAGCAIYNGWQLKPFAVLWSRFAEVLLLDADQVPISDPAAIFEWPQYRETGAMFWPDIVDIRGDNPVWRALDLLGRTAVSFESGQALIDVSRNIAPMSAVVALNEQAAILYRMIYGDKDSFLLAWRLLGRPFGLVPHRPFVDDRALVQRDFAGAPLFQHRTLCKWTYDGELYSFPGFVHGEACAAAIAELRGKWNGRVFNPPARGPAARALEADLVAARCWVIDIVDEGRTAIELRAHCEFGAGRSFDRQNWFVRDGERAHENPTLVFRDGERTTYEFARTAPGAWTGRRLRTPAVQAVLQPGRGDAVEESPPVAGLVDALLRASGFPDEPDDAALAGALALIAKVETGVPERLHHLAQRTEAGNPELASRLRRLADSTESISHERDVRPLQVRDVLERGYVRMEGSPE